MKKFTLALLATAAFTGSASPPIWHPVPTQRPP